MLSDKNKFVSFNVCSSQEYSDATVKQNKDKKNIEQFWTDPYKALIKYECILCIDDI